MVGIGVVGYGYWGPNLVRNFNELPGARVVAVCDQRQERLAPVALRYPGTVLTGDYRELLRHPDVSGVAVATPVSTHFDLALQALRAGKHVLVEKPITTNAAQARQLIAEAEKRKLTLMADHTFVYTGAVRKMRELVVGGQLGKIWYYDSVRVNLGLFQHDVNVLWDLAVHDLSILDYVLAVQPVAVSSTGCSHVSGQPEDTAYLTLFLQDGLIAHLNVNWLSPVKVRRTLIAGDLKMIVYDDIEPSEKVKVYDRGITLNQTADDLREVLISYRTGDTWAPKLDTAEALRVEAAHFLSCVEKGERPITDGHAGLRVVKVLEASARSLAQHGHPVEL